MNTLRYAADINETGDWSTDNVCGRELAMAWIAEARQKRSPIGINSAIRSIAESERYGGVEGFRLCVGQRDHPTIDLRASDSINTPPGHAGRANP